MSTMQNSTPQSRGTGSLAEFHLEELKLIRAKMEEHIKEMRQMELYSIAGFFGLLAWLASQKPSPQLAVWFLPALIPLMLFLRNKGHNSRIKTLGNYIQKVENYFLQSGAAQDRETPGGFEHHFSESDDRAFELYNRVLYSAMLVVAILAPFVGRVLDSE